jgi:7-keto-8-aminopelargonate synthetase-like enzyme
MRYISQIFCDAALATKFSNAMLGQGVYVIGFSYPVVPKGKPERCN